MPKPKEGIENDEVMEDVEKCDSKESEASEESETSNSSDLSNGLRGANVDAEESDEEIESSEESGTSNSSDVSYELRNAICSLDLKAVKRLHRKKINLDNQDLHPCGHVLVCLLELEDTEIEDKKLQAILRFFCKKSKKPKAVAQVIIALLTQEKIEGKLFWKLLSKLGTKHFLSEKPGHILNKYYEESDSIFSYCLQEIAASPLPQKQKHEKLFLNFVEDIISYEQLDLFYKYAIENSNRELLSKLLDIEKPDLISDKDEEYPIFAYAMQMLSDESLIERFIDIGQKYINEKYGENDKPLICFAAQNTKSNAAVKCLLNREVDVDQQDAEGNAAIHEATRVAVNKGKNEDGTSLDLLISAEADINLQNHEGNTALHIAVQAKTCTLVEKLYEAKADVSIKNREGNTALHLAAQATDVRTVEILCKYAVELGTLDLKNKNYNAALHIITKKMIKCWEGLESESEDYSQSLDKEKSVRVFNILIKNGANILAPDKLGITPYALIKEAVEARNTRYKFVYLKKFLEQIEKVKDCATVFQEMKKAYEDLDEDAKDNCHIEDLTEIYLLAIKDIYDNSSNLTSNQKYNTILKYFEDCSSISENAYQIYAQLKKLTNAEAANLHDNFDLKDKGECKYVYIKHERIGQRWLAIPKKDDEQLKKWLLSTLNYQASRHAWESEKCYITRLILNKIADDKFPIDMTKEDAEKWLKKVEAKDYPEGDYSDDSDEEQARNFQMQTRGMQQHAKSYAEKMMQKANVAAFFTQENKLRKPKKITFNLEDRQTIDHGQIPPHVYNDLNELNNLFRNNQLNEETIKRVGTRFYIAQYRGIHYSTNNWNAEARRKHREFNELSAPYYSRAVASRAQEVQLSKSPQENLHRQAMLLHHQMISLKWAGVIVTSNKAGERYRFDSPSDAIQDKYTKDYKAYEDKLRETSDKCEKGEEIKDAMDVAYLFAKTPKMPNVSTADAPYHALLYALGLKIYKSHPQKVLEPRWHKDGKAEKPSVGKVYTFLMEPVDYCRLQPNHLVSLNTEADTIIDQLKIPERESTFAAYIPAEKVIYQQKAHYLSFNGTYSDYFQIKYGINKEMYKEYKRELKKTSPHSAKREEIKRKLGEHICAYQEVLMIEDARLAARNKDGWLVYRSKYNEFSIVLPRVNTESQKQADKDRATAAKLQQEKINQAKAERRQINDDDNLGWLTSLVQGYKVRAAKNLSHLLKLLDIVQNDVSLPDVESCQSYSEYFSVVDSAEPKIIRDVFNQHCQLLQNLANELFIEFKIKSMLFKDDLSIKPKSGEAKHIHELLYLGGDGFFGLISRNEVVDENRFKIDRVPALVIASKKQKTATTQTVASNLAIIGVKVDQGAREVIRNVPFNNHILTFKETRIPGNGWCLFHAIDIQDPKQALVELNKNLENQQVAAELSHGIYNDLESEELKADFAKDTKDAQGNLIKNHIAQLLAACREQQNDKLNEEINGGKSLLIYLKEPKVLAAYISYIEDRKYASLGIAAAYLALENKRLWAVRYQVGNPQQPYMVLANNDVNPADDDVICVIFKPNQNTLLSHYDRLTLCKDNPQKDSSPNDKVPVPVATAKIPIYSGTSLLKQSLEFNRKRPLPQLTAPDSEHKVMREDEAIETGVRPGMG